MQIYSLFMFLGIFTTLCIPETKRLTLEQLSGEDPMPGAISEPTAVEKSSPNGLEENGAQPNVNESERARAPSL